MSGTKVDLAAVTDGAVDSGVTFGAELLAYTDAVMSRDAEAIAKTRGELGAKIGTDGIVDTAAIISMFNVVDRIADSTGIPIDEGFTRDMRYEIGAELGMNHLTPEERASR